ncbi:hypothetical protein MTR67_030838, partial [Solanum verrucosum]
MQIFRSCKCNPRLPPTDRMVTYGPCWWSVDATCNPSPEKAPKIWLRVDPCQDLRTAGQTMGR